MEKCYCNENCFYFKYICSNNINDESYIEHYDINKCGRLMNENIKKKPCEFYKKELVLQKKNTICGDDKIDDKIDDKKTKNEKYISVNSIVEKINILLDNKKIYDEKKINISNFYGNLNFYLKKIGQEPFNESKETFLDLKKRINVVKKHKRDLIYINYEAYSSEIAGEYGYDGEFETNMNLRIKSKIDILDWGNTEIIENLINDILISRCNNKNSKTKNKISKFMVDFNNIEIEEEEGEEESEEEDEEKNKDDKDDNFDIEEISDDEENENIDDYDDFSD